MVLNNTTPELFSNACTLGILGRLGFEEYMHVTVRPILDSKIE